MWQITNAKSMSTHQAAKRFLALVASGLNARVQRHGQRQKKIANGCIALFTGYLNPTALLSHWLLPSRKLRDSSSPFGESWSSVSLKLHSSWSSVSLKVLWSICWLFLLADRGCCVLMLLMDFGAPVLTFLPFAH